MADRLSRPRPVRLGIVPATLLVALLIQGCSAPGFLKRPVDDFKAYYNTFYNARKAYQRGVEGQGGNTRAEAKVERLRYVNIFAGQNDVRASQDLEAAVLKSADVLRNHPDSKWVDDALLLIGKSYFHQRNLVGSEQKFREVIELGTDLEDEARFWLSRTLVAAGRLEEAEAAIDEALAREDVEDRWESMLRLAKGELRVEEQEWESAAEELATGVEDVPESEIGARAQYLLGQVLETLGRYPEAVRAYQDVNRFRPTYEWSYASQYSSIRVEGLYVDASRALRRLRGMERDDKHYAYRAELLFLRGRIAKATGRADDAWRIYDDLLYDEAYVGLVTDLKGRIHYALGELYRDLDRDFVLAAAHFDTAAAQLRSQLTRIGGAGSTSRGSTNRPDERWAPEAILDAEEMKDAFGAFAKVEGRVAHMDSLLALSALDDDAFEARILEIRQQLAREMEEERRRQEAIAVQQAFARGAGAAAVPATGNRPNRPSGQNAQANVAGFLFHRDAVQAQEGLASFQRTWGDRPLVRDWRRIDAVSRLPEQELVDEFADGAERVEEKPEDALPEVDVAAVPRDSTSKARMSAERAAARYELANALFIGIGRPDSAAHWYRLVLDESGDDDLALRSLFALAEVQRALGDSTSARSVYERIIRDNPDSEFADRGRIRLGLSTVRVEQPDSLQIAEAAYEDAYDIWKRGEYPLALNHMIRVAADHRVLPVRPRSLLAAGLVYLEWATTDDLDLLAPIPFAVEDSVLIDLGLITPPVADSLEGAPQDSAGVGTVLPEQGGDAELDDEQPDEEERENPARNRRRRQVDDLPARDEPEVPSTTGDVGQDPPDSVRPDTAGTGPDTTVAGDSLAVATDSVAFGDPESGVARPDSVVNPVSVSPPEPEVVVDPDAWRKLTLEGLLGRVRDLYGNSPYAVRAGEVLAGIEARRAETARFADSLAALAAAELEASPEADEVSTDRPAPAEDVEGAPSAVDGEEGAPAIAAEAGRPDAPIVEAVENPPSAEAEAVPRDSTRIAVESVNLPARAGVPPDSFTVDEAVPPRLLPEAPGEDPDTTAASGRPVAVDSLATGLSGEVAPETGPSTWPEVSTSSARPLYDVDGTLDVWLVVIESLDSPTAAPAALRRHRESLSAVGTVEMVTGTIDGAVVVYVVVGRFGSRAEAEQAAAGAGDLIGEGAWFLHVMPR